MERVATDIPQLLRSVSRKRGGVLTATRGAGEGGSPLPLLPFGSFFDFAAKVEPNRDELEALILAGAFDRLHANLRALLWAVPDAQSFMRAMRPSGPKLMLPFDLDEPPPDNRIDDFSAEERAIYERAYLGLDADRHLMAFERERITGKGGLTTADARRMPSGSKVIAVGNPIRLRFPPTQSGKRVVFFDLEDETGLLNVTAFDDTYQKYGHAIVTSQYVTLRTTIQNRDGHPAFLCEQAFAYKPEIGRSTQRPLPIGASDFLVG